jgi:hypothetical protein
MYDTLGWQFLDFDPCRLSMSGSLQPHAEQEVDQEGGRTWKLEGDEFHEHLHVECRCLVAILAEPELRAVDRTAFGS